MPKSPATAPPGSAGAADRRSGALTRAATAIGPAWFHARPDRKGACRNGSEHNDPTGEWRKYGLA